MAKRIKRAVSIEDMLRKNFETIPLTGKWAEFMGIPEANGVMLVYGHSGNGKTSFLMQLAKELSKHGKVAYNTLEEGARYSMKQAIITTGLDDSADARKNFVILDREPIAELKNRLRRHKSPKFVIIDSFQYTGLNKAEYIALKEEFKNKLFIFNSHADGKEPRGSVAQFVRYDADVKIRVEGYKAFPTSRFGGGEPYVIWEKGAADYWMDIKTNES